MTEVHLVDGTYELFRSHFGQPPRIAPDGMHVSAVRGLIQTLLSMLRANKTTHIAVAFDSEVESFRNEIFPDYNAACKRPRKIDTARNTEVNRNNCPRFEPITPLLR